MRIRNLALVMQDFLAPCKEAVGRYDCLILVRLCLGTEVKCNKKLFSGILLLTLQASVGIIAYWSGELQA